MILIRKSKERGFTQIDWLKSYHSFSFGEYYDQNFMGFDHLRVINEDTVHPGKGFGMHSHRDMEIISYVIEGALEHKDSMGTSSIIRPGEIQRMSAGHGVNHSEFNHSKTDAVHFLQIWITPNKTGLEPSYEQKFIPKSHDNQLILIGSPQGQDGAITIHQKVFLYVAHIQTSNKLIHDFNNKKGWIQVIKGKISINDKILEPGDGAAIKDESIMNIACLQDAEFLLFDMMQ